MRTVDGNRGSAQKLIDAGVKDLLDDKSESFQNKEYAICEQKVRHKIMLRVFFKYNLMRVRQKISFEAILRKRTILELWLK